MKSEQTYQDPTEYQMIQKQVPQLRIQCSRHCTR